MAVKKIENKWYAIGCVIKGDGSKKHYKRPCGKDIKTKTVAKEFEDKLRNELLNLNQDKNLIFSELAKEFLKTKRKVKKASVLTDQYNLVSINKQIGNYKIDKLSSTILQNMIDYFENEKEYEVSYVKRLYAVTKQIFKYAVKKKYISGNPMDDVEYSTNPDEVPEELRYLTPNQYLQFISHVDNYLENLYFKLLYFTGLRKSEARALTWKDFNFHEKSLWVHSTVSDKQKGEAIITSPKSKNSIRKVTMPDILFNSMVDYCYTFNEDLFIFGGDRFWKAETLRQHFNKYKTLSGLHNEYVIHSFRHSHVALLISQATPILDIAKRLGDTVEVIEKTYAHWLPNYQEKAVQKIDLMFQAIETDKMKNPPMENYYPTTPQNSYKLAQP